MTLDLEASALLNLASKLREVRSEYHGCLEWRESSDLEIMARLLERLAVPVAEASRVR